MKRNKLTKLAGVVAAVAMMCSGMTVSAAEDSVYTTQEGDTLRKIAQKVYGDRERWKDIYDANRDVLKDPNKLWVNQQLVIPGGVVAIQQPVPQDTPDDVVTTQQQVPQDTPAVWPEASAEWQTAVALGGPSYVEQNGLQFYQGTSYKSQGERSYGDFINGRFSTWSEFFESNGMITGITIRDAEKEGYQVVTISSVNEGTDARHSWGSSGSVAIPLPHIYDIYTGKILYSSVLYEDGYLSDADTNELEWGGVSYSIDSLDITEWDYDKWDEWSEWDADGNCYATVPVNTTYTVTIPKGYDGLALLVTPVTEDRSSGEYIMDSWKDGSHLMRVSDLYNILNG